MTRIDTALGFRSSTAMMKRKLAERNDIYASGKNQWAAQAFDMGQELSAGVRRGGES